MTIKFFARIVGETRVEVRTVRMGLPTATISRAEGAAAVWRVRLHQGSRFMGPDRPDGKIYASWQEAAASVSGWSGDTYCLKGPNAND